MGLLEKISPKWAFERQAWAQAYKESKRNYDAGGYDRRNRNWTAENESGEQTDRYYRATIRARCRDLERNSDIMNANIHPWIRNVIGKGYNLQSKTPDDALNTRIEELWKTWCKKENCDITGTQNFWDMIRMAVRRKRVDGGVLFMKCYTGYGLVPFKLQMLEVDELDELQAKPYQEGNKVVGGIEYNQYNYAVGYWIRQYSIEGYQTLESRFVERKDIIFYFSKTRPSQIREMPEMVPVVERIREIDGYLEAASMKERIAACLSVFIKKNNPTASIGRGTGAAKVQRTYDDVTLTPGMVTELNPGDDLGVVNPGASATNSGQFVKTTTRFISAGQGLSYEAVSRDLSGVNYSSARQGAIDDESVFFAEQEKLKSDLLSEVFESFVVSCVLCGKLDVPDFWSRKEEYLSHEWIQPPKKWIDPAKEATANKIAIQTGQKSMIDIWNEQGQDYQEMLDNMKKVQEYAAEIGLELDIPCLKGGVGNEG
jgi:lambda family phage portal protein|nr:MAG TPA: portal protein [Caudoviricetes sp.]